MAYLSVLEKRHAYRRVARKTKCSGKNYNGLHNKELAETKEWYIKALAETNEQLIEVGGKLMELHVVENERRLEVMG